MAENIKRKVVFTSINPVTDKEKLYKLKPYVGVSMLNDFFWDPKSIIFWSWIHKKFGSCLIIIGDYLDRHNQVLFNKNTKTEYKLDSLRKGNLMISFLTELNVLSLANFKLIRWQDLYEKVDVKNKKKEIENLYELNPEIKKSIDSSIKEFLLRKKDELIVNSDIAFEFSLKYIFEELAVFSYLIKEGFVVQVYPGTQLEVLKLLANGQLIANTILEKGIYIDVKLKNLK